MAILGATRAGPRHARAAAQNRRYAIVACAAVAAFLPGDVITLLLETVPLYVLYEASILVASFVWRSGGCAAREGAAASGRGPAAGPAAATRAPS